MCIRDSFRPAGQAAFGGFTGIKVSVLKVWVESVFLGIRSKPDFLAKFFSPHLEVHSLGISNLYATQLRQNTIHGSATMSISTAPESGTTIMPTRD